MTTERRAGSLLDQAERGSLQASGHIKKVLDSMLSDTGQAFNALREEIAAKDAQLEEAGGRLQECREALEESHAKRIRLIRDRATLKKRIQALEAKIASVVLEGGPE